MWWASGKPPLNPHPRKKMRSLSGAFSKGYRNHIPNGKCIIWLELPLRNLPQKEVLGWGDLKEKGRRRGVLPSKGLAQSWSQVRLLIVEIEVANSSQNQKNIPETMGHSIHSDGRNLYAFVMWWVMPISWPFPHASYCIPFLGFIHTSNPQSTSK